MTGAVRASLRGGATGSGTLIGSALGPSIGALGRGGNVVVGGFGEGFWFDV